MALIRFGLLLPAVPPDPRTALLDQLAELCRVAESSGFDSLWVPDPFWEVGAAAAEEPGSVLALEAYTVLGALATSTTRARLGALVSPVGWRPPAMVAKQVTTLDLLSGGRAVLGLGLVAVRDGAGSSTHRGDAAHLEELEDTLQICRAMFDDEAPTVAGHHHTVTGAANRPRPVQAGGPPILVIHTGELGTLGLAVALADGCILTGRTQTLPPAVETVHRLCADHGRDPSAFAVIALITVSPRVYADPVAVAVAAELEPLLSSGVDGVVLDVEPDVDPEVVRALGAALVATFGPAPSPM
jgi:alkanesulfonate monooxygenase SsuD/methylene tetrahydromethanopterin reductase-like flavin-dependent oxidoreductase (luciferase family)